MQHVKLTVVGDAGVGKTSLLITYTTNAFPSEYIPTIFDSYTANVMLDARPVQLNLNEAAQRGGEYDRFRLLEYGGTQIFIICFAINDRHSFESVSDHWVPEITRHRPGIPFILCGTKSDLRSDSDSNSFVSLEEANEIKIEIGASKFVEISAKTQSNLQTLFNDAIRFVLNERLELVINNNNNENNENIAAQRREFKCECDWREVLNQSWQMCAFVVALSVYILIDIFALIVAYQQYKTKDECWNELDSLWIHPKIYLIAGAFVSIIGVGLGIIFKTLCGIDEEQQDVPRLFLLCFFIIWSIFGYVLAADIGTIEVCHQQSIGKMILAWSIVKNVEFCCGSLDIVVNAYKFHFMN